MSFAAGAGDATGEAAGVKAADQAEMTAGLKAKVAADSLNPSTNQPFYQIRIPKGGERYARGNGTGPQGQGPQTGRSFRGGSNSGMGRGRGRGFG
jgi:hypothetical protein